MKTNIAFDKNQIESFCVSHHIRKALLFGSYASGEPATDSDIDILVEFDEGRTPGLGFFSLEEELSRLLGKRVDLNTPAFLAPDIREAVYRSGVILYAA